MGKTSTSTWIRRHMIATDGPDRGRPLVPERWQRGLLAAIDRERKPIVAVMASSQVGKTTIALGVGMRTASDGDGVLLASATDVSVRDLGRRLDETLDASPNVNKLFVEQRGGPGNRSSWRQRITTAGGWLGMAAAGSASQLASRTARVAVADETARWPAKVRGGEGNPLQLLRARLFDYGEDARLIQISSPVHALDPISLAFRDGDRRRLEYACLACGELTPLLWEQVAGRESGETPQIACARCGCLHDERARRRMLRSARWVAQRPEPTDEDIASFTLSRLDSRRATLQQVVREWRRARRAVERGDPMGLAAFRNTVLGLPSSSGAADVDKLYEQRERTFNLDGLEQVTAGIDVQTDRLYWVALGFGPANRELWALGYGCEIGDPRSDEVWRTVAGQLDNLQAPLPVSIVGVDSGYLPTEVRQQCMARRWWVPTIGRAQDGLPIARPVGPSGAATIGKANAAASWSGAVAAGQVHLPQRISRQEIGQLCAAEALTLVDGALRWRPVENRPNHWWDAALIALWARHFRTLSGRPRAVRSFAA